MAYWGAVAAAAGSVADSWISSSSAHKANRTNLQLQQRQQKWEEHMSNTAVQRRVKDITAAGGNPALAFTNGQSASTPSVAPATVEPTYRGGAASGIIQGMAAIAQIRNTAANTDLQKAQARAANVEADLREQGKKLEGEARFNRFTEQIEWDNIKTRILRSTDTSTALQAKRLEDTLDALIREAKAQSRAKQLDTEALENIAKIGGIEAGKMQGILQLFIKLITD